MTGADDRRGRVPSRLGHVVSQPVPAALWTLASALVVAVPLLQGNPGGAAALMVLVLAATVVVTGQTTYVVGRAPAPAVVRRRASQLPPPLAVTVPRVPTGPRAPGRR